MSNESSAGKRIRIASSTVELIFVDPGGTAEPLAVQASTGQSILEIAHSAGVNLVATCGGRGRCRSCRVKILKGDLPPPTVQDQIQLGHEAVREHFRLSCQTKVFSHCTVMLAPPTSEAGHQILGARSPQRDTPVRIDSGVAHHVIAATLDSGSAHAQASDAEVVRALLGERCRGDFSLEVLRRLPGALRDQSGLITVTTFNGEVIDVQAGDAHARKYGMAFDIGTTTIVGTLLNLDTGEQLAAVSGMNPQATYGGDLMSRIAFAQFDAQKLATLRARVLNAINEFVNEASRRANVRPEHIYKMVLVGNTCMHHMFFGIDTSYLGMAPYAPVAREPIVVPSRELPLKAAPNAQVCFLPLVAGFVGADTVGAVLATRMHESEEMRLLVDIGTNGEVVLGSKDRLMACSAPAGPAFEGGQIAHGMRAALGAVEGVQIDADIVCTVIGGVPPIGICGSGLIDAIAKMRRVGLLDDGGALCPPDANHFPERFRKRLRASEHGLEFVLIHDVEANAGEDLTITQNDVRQLQLAKAAIYSGIVILQRVMGVADEGIEELMLCGGFGNYINIESAVGIGLLPPLPAERITYMGNAAHTGAEIALLSEAARDEARAIARRIEHVGLAEHADFEEVFVRALSLAVPLPKQFGETGEMANRGRRRPEQDGIGSATD